jgi:hypothetical protein
MATWQIKGLLVLASALTAIALAATTSAAKPTPWAGSAAPGAEVVAMAIGPLPR